MTAAAPAVQFVGHVFTCRTCNVTWATCTPIPASYSAFAEEVFRREHGTHDLEIVRESM